MNIYNETNNVIIHETSVDFVLRPCFKEIHVVQFDKTLPVVKVELFKNGEKYIIPDEAAINIRFGKLDHTFVMKPVLGCNEERTAVYFEVDEQMTVIAGRVSPVLEMVIGSNIAYSSPIGFVIDKNPVQMSDVESATVVYPVIYELIGTVSQFESRISALESQLVDLDSLESRVDTLEGNVTAWNAKYDKPETGIPASDLADLDASKITSGTFADARIASASIWNAKYDKPVTGIPASDLAETYVIANTNITAGTHAKITYDAKGLVTGGSDLATSDIPDLDASKITSGTFAVARIPNLSASKITSGTFADARIASASIWNAKYDKPATGIPASDLAETYIVANEFNIQNGTGTNAVRQKMADATVDFTGRNPNAEALDPTISATINTGATGNQSSAFGKNTMSLATASFTNGNKTLAKGEESHAEGYQSVSFGDGSHAEGNETVAYGSASHSEGIYTQAIGNESHAEGNQSITYSQWGHAEGVKTVIKDNYLIVDSGVTPSPTPTPTPDPSTPEEKDALNGVGAHAEGHANFVLGLGAHAEGISNKAYGRFSHAEGGETQAGAIIVRKTEGGKDYYTPNQDKQYQHAEGYQTKALGTASHAEGYGTIAGYDFQHVSGKYNNNKSTTLFEVGNGSSGAPSNAFEVHEDGHAEIGLMGSTNLSVATKGYVDGLLPKLYKHIITHNQLGANEKLIVFSFYATLDENSYLALQKIVDRAIFVGLIPSSTSDANYYQIIMNRSSAGVNCMGYYFSSTTPTSVTVYNPMVNGHITDTITEI